MSRAKENWNAVLIYPEHDCYGIAAEYIEELEKQNEELIKFLLKNYGTEGYGGKIVSFVTIKELLEKIKQKPIEEIIKEYE